ncbi:MAG: hypothetical protein MI866_17690 [Bacteroidales bacterium]|nr:hypothetical protein [Bacteroidales bacterium]
MNIKFEYLYRDEDNYKTFGEAVFSNPNHYSLDYITNCIEKNLIEGAWFEPDNWNIPRFSFHKTNLYGINDYLWYEFEQLSHTNDSVTGGSINELLSTISQ